MAGVAVWCRLVSGVVAGCLPLFRGACLCACLFSWCLVSVPLFRSIFLGGGVRWWVPVGCTSFCLQCRRVVPLASFSIGGGGIPLFSSGVLRCAPVWRCSACLFSFFVSFFVSLCVRTCVRTCGIPMVLAFPPFRLSYRLSYLLV